MLKKVVLILLVLAVSSSCARQPKVRPTPLKAGVTGSGIMHRMVKGETIWRLAETYGVKAEEILRANRISNPNELKVGTLVRIPKAAYPKRILPYLPDTNRWKYIVVHHSATEVGNAELFDKGHRRRGFWNGLGYHFVIDNGSNGTADGQIETGHRWNHQMDGAHCNAKGMNQYGIGICLVGNFDKERPSQAQLDSLVWLVRQLQAKYRIPASNVLRHEDVPGKDTRCPGRHFPWPQFRRSLL